MQNCFIKMFKLQEFFIEDSKLENEKMIITVRAKTKGVKCRDCGRHIKTVHQYLKPRRIKHMFWEGNLVLLIVKTRAFFCWQCQKNDKRRHITVERFKSIPPHRGHSLSYADQIMRGLGDTSFKTRAEIAQSSFSVISKLLKERIDPLIGVWLDSDSPIVSLGLDCHSFSGNKMLPTVTDISNHRLVSILPDDKRTTVEQFLRQIPPEHKETIREVCIDMCRDYYRTIQRELPKAQIVVDAFHVIADANRKLSELRTTIQKADKVRLPKVLFDKPKEHLKPNERVSLNEINKAYPELFELWKYKEELRRIYKIPNQTLAKISFNSMTTRMKLSKHPSTKQWLATLMRWKEEILAYFSRFTTNGYTEGVNTKLKTIKRISYGFRNIDNYIRKSMLAFMPISLLMSHYLT